MSLIVLTAVGVLLRVLAFLRPDPLFIDEAMLAHSIATRSWAELIPPFTYQQVAPPGVLWLAKLTTSLFGMSEQSLRVGALLASIAALIAFAVTARRLLPRWPGFVATGVMVLSPVFLRYSDEFKQYGFDVLAAVLLIGATARLLGDADPRRRRWWVAIGGFAILTSTAAPLIAASAWLGALLIRRGGADRRMLITAAVVWGAITAAVFVGYYGQTDTPYLRRYWATNYLDPTAPHLGDRIKGVIDVADALAFRSLVPIPTAILLAVLLLVAAPFWLDRARRPISVVLIGPIVLAGLASMLNRYPIAERTALFALPALALIVGGAIATLSLARAPAIRWLGVAAGALLLVGPAVALFRWRQLLQEPAGVRLATAKTLASPTGPLYVEGRAMPEFLFYSTNWRHPDLARLARLGEVADRLGPNAGNNPPRSHPVGREGDSLRFDDGGRQLVVGVATGMEVTGVGVVQVPNPDTGWAENESRRFADLGRAPGYLLLARMRRSAISALITAMRARGAKVDTSYADRGVQLLQVLWPDSSPTPPAPDTTASRPGTGSRGHG